MGTIETVTEYFDRKAAEQAARRQAEEGQPGGGVGFYTEEEDLPFGQHRHARTVTRAEMYDEIYKAHFAEAVALGKTKGMDTEAVGGMVRKFRGHPLHQVRLFIDWLKVQSNAPKS